MRSVPSPVAICRPSATSAPMNTTRGVLCVMLMNPPTPDTLLPKRLTFTCPSGVNSASPRKVMSSPPPS